MTSFTKLFNFGENFRKWIRIIYNGGKSCIANNGFISECFHINRSTRQGDPISPLVFILCLEILFITLRSDENIKGFKIENNELKLTAYADDATYFMKNKQSTENLLKTIEEFSKISGLEVNRSKSECLLMNYELHMAGGGAEQFLGVPIVDNLKVLGHYHGKNKLICDYQNFYSKLKTMENIFRMWKQRPLTLFGKNLLINALSNSQFLFNAQIDKPPTDFLKLAEALNKEFLWGGTPKIAHHSIIADYQHGGFKYKDLASLINSINFKFIFNLSTTLSENFNALPKMWIKQLFKIPNSNENETKRYFNDFFSNTLNILDCKFKLPRQLDWRGHPLYYDLLKILQNLCLKTPANVENMLSIPIWYNAELNTKFDVVLSKAGFNFMKDFFPNTELLNLNNAIVTQLTPVKRRQLIQIILKIPEGIGNAIESSQNLSGAVWPSQIISLNKSDVTVKSLNSSSVYSVLVGDKTRLPRGLLHWCEEIPLSDTEIKTSLTFARLCSRQIFDHVFQFKIVTRILPTNQYLTRYRVKDSELCSRCLEIDTVEHSIWSCGTIAPFISHAVVFLNSKCKVEVDINMKQYLFGFQGNKFLGLNHVLLELKKYIFYNFEENVGVLQLFERFKRRIMHLIIKEKMVALKDGNYETFRVKWENFTEIYDFYGPDIQFGV